MDFINEFFSSSSSEDDLDLEEFELIFNEEREVGMRKIPRVENYIETVVHRFNNVDFQETFRYKMMCNLLFCLLRRKKKKK